MTRLFDLITRLALRLRWPTILFTLAVVAAGVLSLTQLNQELLPNIEFPVNAIVVRWPAESAQAMVEQVAIPMENTLSDIPGVLDVTSESGSSFSVATVRSEFGTSQQEVREKILAHLDQVSWPEGIVRGVDMFAPELLEELTPEMLTSLSPDAIRALSDDFLTGLDPELRAQLDAILLTNGKSLPLPQSWVDAAAALSIGIETTADLNPDLISLLYANNPEIFTDLTDDLVLAFAPPVQLALPAEARARLSDAVKAQLDYPNLPASWQAYGDKIGIALRTTADVTPEVLDGSITVLAFDLSAIPVINASASSDELSLAQLKTMVADRVVPELEALDGVGGVTVSGGQALDPDKVLAARDAVERSITRRGTGPRLPLIWTVMAAQQGTPLQTVGDLTPDFIRVASGLGRAVFSELTPEMLRAMSPDVLAALPGYYVAELDEGLRSELEAAAAPAGGLADSEPLPEAVPLPESWVAAAEKSLRGMVAVNTTADLGPLMVSVLLNPTGGDNPGPVDLLADLTPEMLNALPSAVLSGLPVDYYLDLSESFENQLDGRVQAVISQAERREALKNEAPILPASWVSSFAQLGLEIQTAADLDASSINLTASFLPDLLSVLRPEVVLWLAEADPSFLSALDPAALQLLSADALAAVRDAHPEFWAGLDDDQRTLLDGIADGLIVAESYEDTVNRTNGEVSLRLSVAKERDANTVATVHRLWNRMEELEKELGNVQFDIVFEQASFIEESITGVAREGVLGAVFAVIVIMAFLSGQVAGRYRPAWRSTLVTAVSIPTSLLAALILLWATGSTLNIMTLSGLTVAIGRVVDDSIVVLENIYRHIQSGEERGSAVVHGTREVALAIFASTATTVVVFLPIGLIGGIIGEFFLPFALAVTFALVSSFMVAVTLVPLLAYLFIRKEHLPEERESWMQRGYTRTLHLVLNPKPWANVPVLRWFLNTRIFSMIVATIIIIGSMVLMVRLPQTFIPSLGEPTININLSLQRNDLIATDATATLVEDKLEELRQGGRIESYQTIVGSGGGFESFFGGGVSQNQAALEAVPARGEDVEALAAELRTFVEGLVGAEHGTVSAADIASSGLGSFELVVTAENVEDLAKANEMVMDELEKVEGFINIKSSLRVDRNGQAVTIGRSNGQPAVTFTAEVVAQDTLGISQEAHNRVAALALPAGVGVTQGFSTEQQTSGFADMGKSIGFSVIIVYVVMVLTFGAALPPFDILFSLPFAVVGAAVALTVTNRVLGISSMVGLMMLVGIVVTNAIVLLQLVQQLRRRGHNAEEALIEAGAVRLRPIWMTALAAILALIPLAIGFFASGAIIGADLATVVIGGLLFSTLISLAIVPIVYSLTDSIVSSTAGRLRNKRTARKLTRILMGEGAAKAIETE
jgi:HAE1 family hydrophobic/amphiphilic exporter-1